MNRECIAYFIKLGQAIKILTDLAEDESLNLSKHNPYFDSSDADEAEKLCDLRQRLSYIYESIKDVITLIEIREELD